jgi:hypothetical protein
MHTITPERLYAVPWETSLLPAQTRTQRKCSFHAFLSSPAFLNTIYGMIHQSQLAKILT